MSKANGDILSYGKPRNKKTKFLISKRLKEVLVKRGVSKKCPICGTYFYVFPCNILRGNGKVCSKRCATILGNMNRKKQDTDIELILEKWLLNNNIAFKKQVSIDGITIVDFFIEPNICLYADGDYWHNLDRVKYRDKWITSQLKKKQYNVIRLLGSEIKEGVRPIEILQ